jgi:hypothetical protein
MTTAPPRSIFAAAANGAIVRRCRAANMNALAGLVP